jgi:hypothetical protein
MANKARRRDSDYIDQASKPDFNWQSITPQIPHRRSIENQTPQGVQLNLTILFTTLPIFLIGSGKIIVSIFSYLILLYIYKRAKT